MVKASAEGLGGVVASEHGLASFVGARILSAGGNAVDAAVATSLALAVLVPHLGGVGGDFFMLYRSPDGRVYHVNGSSIAPKGMSVEEFKRRGLESVPERGVLSALVPGMLKGLYESWRRFGSLEWSELVRPARDLASRGFPLPRSTSRAVYLLRGCLEKDPGSRQAVLRHLLADPGTPVRLPGLASLLAGYAEDPEYPYRGDPAEALEEYVSSRGGLITAEDLRALRAEALDPVSMEYGDSRIYEMPPNTQGITTFHVLMFLQDLGGMKGLGPLSAERAERLASAARIAYTIRDEHLGDPRYMKLGVEELLDTARLRSLASITEEFSGRSGTPRGFDTTFFAVADGEGGVVAGIQSLFQAFGSCVTEPTFQITLNNRALGFTLEEGKPSTLRPGAKPLHTLSALIVEDLNGGRVAALGASGGHLRPQQHALFVTNLEDYRMDVLEAINIPRAVWDPGRNTIIYEDGWEPREGWEKVARIGVANAVEVVGNTKKEYTDGRSEGLPVAAYHGSR